MPHIRMRGLEEKVVARRSKEIIEKLGAVTDTPKDWFTLEYINSNFYYDNEKVKGYPFVEILWFDRGDKAKDEIGIYFDKLLKKETGAEDVTVVFIDLEGENYYENGKNFK